MDGMTNTNLLPHFIYKPTKSGTLTSQITNKGAIGSKFNEGFVTFIKFQFVLTLPD